RIAFGDGGHNFGLETLHQACSGGFLVRRQVALVLEGDEEFGGFVVVFGLQRGFSLFQFRIRGTRQASAGGGFLNGTAGDEEKTERDNAECSEIFHAGYL